MQVDVLKNFIAGEWVKSRQENLLDVLNPATAELVARVALSSATEVNNAVVAGMSAYPEWRQTPAVQRVQYLFKLKQILEENFEDLSQMITMENGKTLSESRGEMRRAIENVEVACGIPALLQSEYSEDIAPGIDEYMIRQPLGVAAIIAPFNFPGMIPFWFLPYAVACGNTVIVKPSERCPMTMQKVFQLFEQIEFPPGVVNLVNGSAEAVHAILDHPEIKAISFVGSTPVAKLVYSRGTANGKRVQAQGGAKNPLVIMPDADLDITTRIVADSAFGNAGQRCLAASTVITVGAMREKFTRAITEAAQNRVVGYGLEPTTTMGPVITPESRQRILGLIQQGIDDGAELLLGGREINVSGYPKGNFLPPTILNDLPLASEVARTEIFGPVLTLVHVNNLDQAIEIVNQGQYGNMACLFTSSGGAARKFRYEVQAGNVGINIGVAAPMAFFPFSGWKDSFFGTLHGQARHAVEFYTQTKVVVERWDEQWSRRF